MIVRLTGKCNEWFACLLRLIYCCTSGGEIQFVGITSIVAQMQQAPTSVLLRECVVVKPCSILQRVDRKIVELHAHAADP